MPQPKTPTSVQWLEGPEEHDYPAAASFLLLLKPQTEVDALISVLRFAPIVSFKAKDIFRASGLALLGEGNSHVDSDRQKILAGHRLSPLLLVRDDQHGRVLIADGYHRLCALYSFDEDASVPCKIF